jgi:hypothetical protein
MTSQIAHLLPHNQFQALTKKLACLSSSIVEMYQIQVVGKGPDTISRTTD